MAGRIHTILNLSTRRGPRRLAVLGPVLAALAAGGCSTSARPLFEPLDQPLVWPAPPDPARIQYLGAIETDQDLKPGRSLGEAIGSVLFGKRDSHSMLTPFAIAGDPPGSPHNRIFICDSNAQLIHIFDLNSRRYDQWRPAREHEPFAQPIGIAFDASTPEGRVLVTDPVVGGVYIFDARGRGQGWIGQEHLGRPCGIAIDAASGRMYIADTGLHQVIVLDPAGALVAAIGARGSEPGSFNFPTNVAIDGDSRLYVSDSLNFRVQVFDQNLEPLQVIGGRGNRPGHFSQPKGLAADRHGHLYIIDAHFEAVQIFDRQGRLLLSFGEEGRGPGQFWLPTGLFIGADDRIWVADSYNRRIQVFEYLNPPSAEVTSSSSTPFGEVQP